MVDNAVSSFIEKKDSGFIIKKFSKDSSNSLEIGLIDDSTQDLY